MIFYSLAYLRYLSIVLLESVFVMLPCRTHVMLLVGDVIYILFELV